MKSRAMLTAALAVLLYDRTHDALWSQINFGAVSGPYAGRSLKHLPWELTTFADWKQRHPDSTVQLQHRTSA
jgi:hypothetical protein